MTTNVGLREGVARYDVPDLPVGRLGTTDVLLTGVHQTVDLGLAFTDWLSAAPRIGLGEESQPLESGKPTLSHGQLILRYIW
ncbi:hypothetical protein ACLESD_48285 [Pyxidicoccus sp. 3LFB2]